MKFLLETSPSKSIHEVCYKITRRFHRAEIYRAALDRAADDADGWRPFVSGDEELCGLCSIQVQDGQTVRAGDMLIELDPRRPARR